MTEANVSDEMFSDFASKSVTPHTVDSSLISVNRYPDVREVQLGVFMEHSGSPKVKEAFLRAMEKYSSMPRAKPVLSAFYDNFVARPRCTGETGSAPALGRAPVVTTWVDDDDDSDSDD